MCDCILFELFRVIQHAILFQPITFAFWLRMVRMSATSIFVSVIPSMFEFVQGTSVSRLPSSFVGMAMRFRLVAPSRHSSGQFRERSRLPATLTMLHPGAPLSGSARASSMRLRFQCMTRIMNAVHALRGDIDGHHDSLDEHRRRRLCAIPRCSWDVVYRSWRPDLHSSDVEDALRCSYHSLV